MQPYNQDYIKILHQFGDSELCSFSIHNLVQAGKGYGLAAGSWLGPYAMCRTWETLARENSIEEHKAGNGKESLPFAVYVVSGDGDGERGGAPVLCRDVASRVSAEFSKGSATWTPIVFLVPLVLGLDRVNPRYIEKGWCK
jgi:cysteine protease ATG4